MDVTLTDIFDAIPKNFDGSAAGDWNANIQFRFGDDDCWFISVADGSVDAGQGEVSEPSATIVTAADTWIGMSTGTVDPMQAFMTGNLRVEGNMSDVMKLQDRSIFKRS